MTRAYFSSTEVYRTFGWVVEGFSSVWIPEPSVCAGITSFSCSDVDSSLTGTDSGTARESSSICIDPDGLPCTEVDRFSLWGVSIFSLVGVAIFSLWGVGTSSLRGVDIFSLWGVSIFSLRGVAIFSLRGVADFTWATDESFSPWGVDGGLTLCWAPLAFCAGIFCPLSWIRISGSLDLSLRSLLMSISLGESDEGDSFGLYGRIFILVFISANQGCCINSSADSLMSGFFWSNPLIASRHYTSYSNRSSTL